MAMARESQPELDESPLLPDLCSGRSRSARRLLTFVELRTDQMAEFGFDGTIIFVRVFDDFLGDLDVFSNGSCEASIITL